MTRRDYEMYADWVFKMFQGDQRLAVASSMANLWDGKPNCSNFDRAKFLHRAVNGKDKK